MSAQRTKLSLEKSTVLGVLRAADRLRRYFQEIFGPYGLTSQQFNVLRILRGAGEDGLPTLEVADRMIEKTPGVTRLLDRLEVKGWVERRRGSRDRRRVYCTITEEGLALLAELDEPVEQADRVCTEGLSRGQQVELQSLVDQVGP